MYGVLLSLWLGAAAAAPALGQAGPAEPGISLNAIRLYRAEGNTRIKVFLEIPHRLLSADSAGRLQYRITITVQDSTGLAIMNRSWSEAAKVVPGSRSALAMEMLEFAVRPGRYLLTAGVRDSLSGRTVEAQQRVFGYAEPPVASDLVLTPALRVASTDDSMPRSGEWRHGNLVLVPSALVRVPLEAPRLFYMVETYASHSDSALVTVEVLSEAGKPLTGTRPRMLGVDSGGSVVSGGVDLGGVPPGNYRLRVTIALGGKQAEELAPFTVQRLVDAGLAIEAPTPEDSFFAAMGSAQLDSLKDPLAYIAEAGELGVYNEKLSVEAKRRFLTAFWKRRAKPGESGNAMRDRFYELIADANTRFKDPGRGSPQGWRTDRGRVFLRYGPPDDVWRRTQEGITPALEVWRYSKARDGYFIFADRSGLGAFRLIHSSELKEPGQADWQDQMGFYGLRATEQYLGVNLGLRGAEPR